MWLNTGFYLATRKSALSLYRPDIATMESGKGMAEWSAGVLEYWIGLPHDSITPRCSVGNGG
ncbi:MAG: hypothetical protein NT105_23930 [Verrucomicrobia bacterium]|nr:hypothetical protein [Verrucomicrobiota bacterium]